MKKMRIPLIIALGVAILGIIFGSFFDFQISSAIASPTNAFALTASAVLPTIGFAGVAVMGGGFLALIIKGKYHIVLKILFGVLAAACLGVAIFYPAGEYFGSNGFYQAAPKWVGYLIVILPETGALVGGYFLFKDCKNKNMWIVFVVIVALLLIALLGVIPAIKSNMHRPRYRLVSSNSSVDFHNWWQPFKGYNDLVEAAKADGYGKDELKLLQENCKSFPSGHTAEVSILFVVITFFPMAHEKMERYQLPVFIASGALVLLVAIARILAAAHYLSDVSWGATIMISLTLIANEVLMRIKSLQLPQEAPEEDKEVAEKQA